MPACPQCGATYDAEGGGAERCAKCGSFIPRSGTVQPVWSETSHAHSSHLSEPVPPPKERPQSDVPEDDRPSSELIRPRNLSSEYAERVTSHWAKTDANFRHPQDTIHSDADTTEREEDLRIGTRSVINVEDVEDGKHGDYELADEIGSGGMGVVWSARQSSLNRDVAIKYPKKKVGQTEQQQNKFIFEVVVTGRLDHPNIVPIYDLARDEEGRLFYAMKRVNGKPWDKCIHDGSLSFNQNIEILMKVCDAIRFAHDQEVIHCDIKPQNIMVGRYGEVSVMDFGAAVRLVNGVAVASAGGTFSYMAPEIASDSKGQICPATDVYLLGAVLYEIITGEPPHPPPADSKDRAEMFRAAAMIAARNEIRPISGGGELAEIAHRALATDISDRYQRVDDLQHAIRNYISHAESIALAERGRQHLREATDESHGAPKSPGARFDAFDRGRFAFEEAITLWPENETAKKGLAEAIIASAKYALHENAYSRGIALLDAKNPEHAKLLGRLNAARRRNNRLATMLRLAAVVIIIGGAAFATSLYVQRERAIASEVRAKDEEKRAIANAKKAFDQQQIAESNAIEAAKQERKAKEFAKKAFEQEEKAIANAETALIEERKARTSEAKAQHSSYVSEIGVAEKALQRNAFTAVSEILKSQRDSDVKRPLRDWEWGYLNHLATDHTEWFDVLSGAPSQRFETAAISADGLWVAAGSVDGTVYVWRREPAQNEPAQKLVASINGEFTTVNSIAVASSGTGCLVAVAGDEVVAANGSDSRSSAVKIWTVDRTGNHQSVDKPISQPASLLSVAFSRDATELLTSAADGTAKLWNVKGGKPLRTFPAELLKRSVWSAQFSPDEQWIVTAAEDGFVRIWSRDGNEWERFSGQVGPAYTAQFSRDGKHVITGGQDGRLLTGVFDRKSAASWREDQLKQIKTGLAGSGAAVYSSKLTHLGEHAAAIKSISTSPDGRYVFSAGNDNTVRVWDVSQGFDAATLDKTLRGHGGWVHACVAIETTQGQNGAAQNQSQVLSAGYDGRVLLWDWKNYHAPRVLADEREERLSKLRLTSAAVSRNAEWISTASDSGIVTMWDMQNWSDPRPQELREGHDWQASTGIFFDGGRRLLTAGGDNTALVWDARNGNELLRLGGWLDADGTGWRGVAAVSHDGRRIATGSNLPKSISDGHKSPPVLARMWDATSNTQLNVLAADPAVERVRREPSEATALAFSPDDKLLVVGDQWGMCHLFDATSGRLRRDFAAHTDRVVAARFLPDGKTLLTAATDGQVTKWDLAANPPRQIFQLQHGDQVVSFDVTSDGQRIITASGSKDNRAVVRLWNVETGAMEESRTLEQVLTSLGLEKGPMEQQPFVRHVAFHPTNPSALITVYDPNAQSDRSRVAEWSWGARDQRLKSVARQADVSMAVYSPQSRNTLLTVGGRGARLLAPTSSNPNVAALPVAAMTFRPQSGIKSVSFSADGRSLACAGSDGSIKIWKLSDGRRWISGPTLPGQPGASLSSIAFHPLDSECLVTAGTDGVKLWRQTNDQWNVDKTMPGPAGTLGRVEQAVFMDDGQTIVAASQDHGVILWNFAVDTAALSIENTDNPNCVAVSHDGRWIAVGSGKDIFLREVATSRRIPIESGHSADVSALCFSTNGRRLFSASQDFTVKVWDTSALANREQPPPETPNKPELKSDEEVRELITLGEHQGFVNSVNYVEVPGQRFLLTTSLDGQAIIWPCTME